MSPATSASSQRRGAGAGADAWFAPLSQSSFAIGEEIGKGRFKSVCKGTLEPDAGPAVNCVVFRYPKGAEGRELAILASLAKTRGSSRFVPEIFGACEGRLETLLLQERAIYGSLKMALSEDVELRDRFTPLHRTMAASQVCQAMAYLESARIVHADVSCRNCLLFRFEEEPVATLVKVTDFGLAHWLPQGEQEVVFKQAQAVRWCAPETVAHSRLNSQADIWSVGVTLWELFTGGQTPWPLRTKRAHVSAILTALGEGGADALATVNRVLQAVAPQSVPFTGLEQEFPQPEDCPKIIYDLILSCFTLCEDPVAGTPGRSTARELAQAFDRFIERSMRAPDSPNGGSQNARMAAATALPDPAVPPSKSYWVQPLATKSRRLVQHSAPLVSEESVTRITSSPALLEFADWALARWDQLHEMFGRGTGNAEAGRLSLDRWTELVRNKGFRGDAQAVFAEIASEEVGTAVKGRSVRGYDNEPLEITRPQLKRFEARVVAANACLPATEEGSVAARFARALRQQRGSVLRAWRNDFDTRGAGSVTFSEFGNACRQVGLRDQARLVWDCLRQEGGTAPLEFHELAPDEAENLEAFAEVVQRTHSANFSMAWEYLDDTRKNYLTLADFIAGAARLGFAGDAKQIFQGLEASGSGRLLQPDFAYIGKVTRASVPTKAQAHRGPMAELVAFARSEAADADDFFAVLGIGHGQAEIAINDLGARLTAIGFEGDALLVASRLARGSGGACVATRDLRALLSGERGADGGPSIPSLAPPGPMRVRPASARKEAWNGGVDNISDKNVNRCTSSRFYFSAPKRG